MRLLAVLSVILVVLVSLTGCAAPPPEPTPESTPASPPETGPTFGPDGPLASGGMHVLVVGGIVNETGGPDNSGLACDRSSPRFSADDDQETLWYVPRDEHPADPRAGDLAVIRLDHLNFGSSEVCWTRYLEVFGNRGNLTWQRFDVARTIPVRLEEGGVRVNGVLLTPGQETDWRINGSCACAPNGSSPRAYEGTLHVQYLGDWGDPVLMDDTRDLPPMDVPSWAEAHSS